MVVMSAQLISFKTRGSAKSQREALPMIGCYWPSCQRICPKLKQHLCSCKVKLT